MGDFCRWTIGVDKAYEPPVHLRIVLKPQAYTAFLILVFALLAGCAGKSAQTPVATSSSIVANEEDVGSVQGLVVDDAQLPIEGAAVRADDDAAARRITDAQGRFEIDLAPGAHVLLVERAGYTAATSNIEVAVAEIVATTIVLNEIPTSVPRVVSYTAEAIIELGVNALGVYYYGNSSGSQYRDIFYPMDADAQSAVTGLRWTAASPASAKWMMLSLWLSDPQCRGWCKEVGQNIGRSPLVVQVDNIPIARDDHWDLSLNPYIAIEPPCMVATATRCAEAPDAVAQLALDQRFQLYTTLFFVDPAPAEYDPFPPS